MHNNDNNNHHNNNNHNASSLILIILMIQSAKAKSYVKLKARAQKRAMDQKVESRQVKNTSREITIPRPSSLTQARNPQSTKQIDIELGT